MSSSTSSVVYLDQASSALPDERFVAAYVESIRAEGWVNQEAAHRLGTENRIRIDTCTAECAARLTGHHPDAFLHWSATGSDAAAALCTVLRHALPSRAKIATTLAEHPAITDNLEACFPRENLTFLPLDSSGRLRLEALETCLVSFQPDVLMIQHVNSEVGAIQDLTAIRALLDRLKPDCFLCIDGIQSAGKIPLEWPVIRPDAFLFSTHKWGAPPLGGVCCTVPAWKTHFLNLRAKHRIGRPDWATLKTGALALNILSDEAAQTASRLRALQHRLQPAVEAVAARHRLELRFPVAEAERSPWIFSFLMREYQAAILVRMLSQHNVMVSAGSACMSEQQTPSALLKAMNVPPPFLYGLLRLSFSGQTTWEALERFLTAFDAALTDY